MVLYALDYCLFCLSRDRKLTIRLMKVEYVKDIKDILSRRHVRKTLQMVIQINLNALTIKMKKFGVQYLEQIVLFSLVIP